jgi:hypothetical protein
LNYAAIAKGNKSRRADKKFQHATSLLCYYEWRSRFRDLNYVEYKRSDESLFQRMEEAMSYDSLKSSSARTLLRLREVKVRLAPIASSI